MGIANSTLQAHLWLHAMHDHGAQPHLSDDTSSTCQHSNTPCLWLNHEVNLPTQISIQLCKLDSHVQQRLALLATCLKRPCLR